MAALTLRTGTFRAAAMGGAPIDLRAFVTSSDLPVRLWEREVGGLPWADGRYDEYIRSTDEQSARDGVTGTPTYRLNGETVDFATVNTPELFVQAVENATE